MKLSLCMPTWNRAQMLDYTLGKVLEAYGDRVEVVVADNSSTDDTPEVVRSYQSRYCVRYVRHKEVRPYLGQWIAMRNATCPFIAFMADDDWILPNVFDYVQQLLDRPELSAVYSDLIAWDDENEREIHRYFHLTEAAEFGADNPIGLVNFVCKRLIYPEIGVFRREAFLKSDVLISRGNLPNHLWMYRMSRVGKVRFETAAHAYYREHRVVKAHLARTPTSNLTGRMGYIGDEFRNVLEKMLLWAFYDSGLRSCPESNQLNARRLVENFLLGRVPLEIRRARDEANGMLANELKARFMLWNGWPEETIPDHLAIIHAVVEICRNLGLDTVAFVGVEPPQWLSELYPDIRVGELSEKSLAVYAKDDSRPITPGHCVYLNRLMEQYST